METTTYTALCERAGRWWTIRVPQVDGLTARVRSLDQAEMMTRQSIIRALGVAAESVRVEVIPEAPPQVSRALEARHAARQALELAVNSTISALGALAQEGFAFHDAATMLGLSPAEVAQYAPSSTAGSAQGPAGTSLAGTGLAGTSPAGTGPVAETVRISSPLQMADQ